MNTITDEQMRERLLATKPYTIVILKAGPNRRAEGADKVVWEHGRRNFQLREDGRLSIVCPVMDGTEVSGVGIFNLTPERTVEIMQDDPAVKAGVLVFEIHPTRAFPGDSLPV
ncbi:MAG: hypothetical protein JWN09_183 [Microbacteriaceae bacterium]|nr:hypothetical protein [Microbacteriaceae bacterium]